MPANADAIDPFRLPFCSARPDTCTDALRDFHLGVDRTVNFIASLLATESMAANQRPDSAVVETDLPISSHPYRHLARFPVVEITEGAFHPRLTRVAEGLFNTGLGRLHANYKLYIKELLRELLWSNRELIDIDDDKESPGRTIGRELLKRLDRPYGDIVEHFKQGLGIDMHPQQCKVPAREIEHLEAAVWVGHRLGEIHAAEYLKSMEMRGPPYPPPFAPKAIALVLDFNWLLEECIRLLAFSADLDARTRASWRTSVDEAVDGSVDEAADGDD